MNFLDVVGANLAKTIQKATILGDATPSFGGELLIPGDAAIKEFGVAEIPTPSESDPVFAALTERAKRRRELQSFLTQGRRP
ncbi:MAG: hypothetical protein JNN11_00815 [Candidatus Doudnabacteria bacterium]|nr:hypothetical protein [Candidatus Doudnabacteria bacterium]